MLTREVVVNTIGKTFADMLDEVVIESGSIHYTRRTMVEVLGCANFIAAARLQAVIKRLKITSAKELYKMDPLSIARSRGIGATSMYVAMCILDATGHDVEKWWGWDAKRTVVKFSTFKAHAMRRASKRKQDVA